MISCRSLSTDKGTGSMNPTADYFRWEEDLRSSFLQRAEPDLWTRAGADGDVTSLCESTCSFGRADWVWARFFDRSQDASVHKYPELLKQPACSRILASLLPQSPRTLDYLQARSGVIDATFRAWMARLSDAMLIAEMEPGRFTLGAAFPNWRLEICSFEFKLSNWRRALYQAKRYRTFSHRVYVVMPSQSIGPASRSIEAFRRSNIGLIEHSTSGDSKRLFVPTKRLPGSRASLIRAMGMLLHQGSAIPASREKSRVARIQSAK